MTTLALAARPLEFFFAQYRRVWRGTAVSSVVTPVFFLLAFGFGLGELVDRTTDLPEGISYLEFVAFRMFMTAAIYLAAIAAFGAVNSPLGILAVPVTVLVGISFAAPIAAWGAYTESDASFVAIFRFLIIPMFLFSGTFFPVSQLPTVLQGIAYVTPLWHGVDLCRQLTLGEVAGSSALAHVGAL